MGDDTKMREEFKEVADANLRPAFEKIAETLLRCNLLKDELGHYLNMETFKAWTAYRAGVFDGYSAGRAAREKEWECPKCGFCMNANHYEPERADPCPVCHEIELERQLAEAREALKQIANCSCEVGHTCVRIPR